MQPHQQRVITERTELDDKLQKLRTFIKGAGNTSVFAELPVEEQVRLKEQASYMSLYLQVLDDRIKAF